MCVCVYVTAAAKQIRAGGKPTDAPLGLGRRLQQIKGRIWPTDVFGYSG